MRSLDGRLRSLERTARQLSGSAQLNIWIAAMRGDAAAAEELRRLRYRGEMAGRLDELYDALKYPVRTEAPKPEDS